jgi:hypothetical protein
VRGEAVPARSAGARRVSAQAGVASRGATGACAIRHTWHVARPSRPTWPSRDNTCRPRQIVITPGYEGALDPVIRTLRRGAGNGCGDACAAERLLRRFHRIVTNFTEKRIRAGLRAVSTGQSPHLLLSGPISTDDPGGKRHGRWHRPQETRCISRNAPD